jgi:serine/threonine-protein kinase
MQSSAQHRPHCSAFRQTLARLPAALQEPVQPPASGPALLQPGARIGPGGVYEIVELLAEGGMALVYRAYHAALDHYVAIKALKPDLPATCTQRFWREARLGASLSHTNLARTLDVGADPATGTPWMAMEYSRGRDLGHLLDRGRIPRLPVTSEILCQVLDALHHVHVRGIVHCDVKPENILLTRDPRDRRILVVKLIDFGIHRDLTPPIDLEQHLSGDPRYMSPEQMLVNGALDGRADLYGVGISLYELVTGTHPFDDLYDRPLEELIEAHCTRTPVPPSRRMAWPTPRRIAEAIDGLFERACAKDPGARFTDALDMRDALERLGELVAHPSAAA